MHTNSQNNWNLIYCQNNIVKHNLSIYSFSLIAFCLSNCFFEDSISILHNFQNLENWLKNLRIILAPGFIRYKIFIFFSIHVYVCKKLSTKRIKVLLLLLSPLNMTSRSCAPLRDSAIREFTHGQRQQDPTSQDSLGVSVKALSRSTCADKK